MEGGVNFLKVSGMDGVFIANTVKNDNPNNPDNIDEFQSGIGENDETGIGGETAHGNHGRDEEIESFITYDNGAEWRPLLYSSYSSSNPVSAHPRDHDNDDPTGDSGSGDPVKQRLSLLSDMYSPTGTTGLIVANGVRGGTRRADSDPRASVFLSRDAGVSWMEVTPNNPNNHNNHNNPENPEYCSRDIRIFL